MPFTPDPALEQVIADLLASAPPRFVEWRRSQIEDDDWQWFRDDHPDLIAASYDPEELERQIKWWRTKPDPFSARSLRLKEFLNAMEAGGRFTVSEIATGNVEEVWEVPKTRHGSARSN